MGNHWNIFTISHLIQNEHAYFLYWMIQIEHGSCKLSFTVSSSLMSYEWDNMSVLGVSDIREK